ncbi:MAG: hypothetical protein JXB36_16660 [Gammaproteobacteria bacterium]|nr:hypothetical protein [Gammaproteobacteria bacterium]
MLEFAEWLQATSLSVAIQSAGWVIPLLQSIHILMIGVVFVSIMMIALRVLQRVRTDQAFTDVWSRFAPWMWTGLVIMTLTGLLLIVAEPVREFSSTSFWLKMLLLAIAVSSAVAFGRSLRFYAGAGGGEPQFTAGARSAAVATLVLWLAIIFLGRAIAYDVEVWGALSLASGS